MLYHLAGSGFAYEVFSKISFSDKVVRQVTSAALARATSNYTGFFFFDEDRPVDPDLERFVESGEPPIVVSFGSFYRRIASPPSGSAQMFRLTTILWLSPASQ
jgi:hypothetical protein